MQCITSCQEVEANTTVGVEVAQLFKGNEDRLQDEFYLFFCLKVELVILITQILNHKGTVLEIIASFVATEMITFRMCGRSLSQSTKRNQMQMDCG